jgi:hypothetical protein
MRNVHLALPFLKAVIPRDSCGIDITVNKRDGHHKALPLAGKSSERSADCDSRQNLGYQGREYPFR